MSSPALLSLPLSWEPASWPVTGCLGTLFSQRGGEQEGEVVEFSKATAVSVSPGPLFVTWISGCP